MKPAMFRAERQKHWIHLRSLVDRIEKRGIRSLSVEEARRLGSLYRSTVSSYTVLKGLTLDRKLVLFLRHLVTRAYLAVYHFDTVPHLNPIRFFTRTWPGLVRRHAPLFLCALAVLVASTWLTLHLTVSNPNLADSVIPAGLAQGRRADSTREELASVLVSGRDTGGSQRTFFAAYLFRHNTEVGIFSFALGVAAGVPTVLLTAYNGLILGAFAGLYESRGLAYPFWAWVLPHGITEFLAILLCATGGLVVGLAVVRPGPLRVRDALVQAGREGGLIVLGTLPLFLLAALIEGVVRQTTLSDEGRYALAFATLVGWALYFTLAGGSARRAAPDPRKRVPAL